MSHIDYLTNHSQKKNYILHNKMGKQENIIDTVKSP